MKYYLTLLVGLITPIAAADENIIPLEGAPEIQDKAVLAELSDFARFRKLANVALQVKVNDRRKQMIAALKGELGRIRQEGTLDDAVKIRDFIAEQEQIAASDEQPLPEPIPRKTTMTLPSTGYFSYGDSKYLMSPKPMPWWRANEIARSLGGHIVRFETVEEFQAVASQFCKLREYVWTDARLYEDGKWYNTDGKPAIAIPWGAGGAGNHGGDCRHLTMSIDGVHDAHGDTQWHFILEIDAKKVPNSRR